VLDLAGAGDGERHAVARIGRRHGPSGLATQAELFAAGDEDRRAAGFSNPRDELGDGRQHVFGVVDEQEPPLAAEAIDQGVEQRHAELLVRSRPTGLERTRGIYAAIAGEQWKAWYERV
jgi:hypothetical protein